MNAWNHLDVALPALRPPPASPREAPPRDFLSSVLYGDSTADTDEGDSGFDSDPDDPRASTLSESRARYSGVDWAAPLQRDVDSIAANTPILQLRRQVAVGQVLEEEEAQERRQLLHAAQSDDSRTVLGGREEIRSVSQRVWRSGLLSPRPSDTRFSVSRTPASRDGRRPLDLAQELVSEHGIEWNVDGRLWRVRHAGQIGPWRTVQHYDAHRYHGTSPPPPVVTHDAARERLCAFLDERDDVPSEYKCPLTLCAMRAPVVADDGHCYEGAALAAWLKTHDTSPLTRQLISQRTTPVLAIKILVDRCAVERGYLNDTPACHVYHP